MNHREITSGVVADAEKLLADGLDAAVVADRLGISLYVVKTIAQEHQSRNQPAPPAIPKKRFSEPQKRIDTGTIHNIQRMLNSSSCNHSEIARQLGISNKTVARVATGQRQTLSVSKSHLASGERSLSKPHRCRRCRALIHILPCRTCFTKLMKRARKKYKKSKIFRAILKKRFNVPEFFVLLVGTFNHFLGGPTMPDLMPFLSAEISALLSAKDKREGVITFAEKMFDQVIAKIDLPGPDAVIDPLLRAAIRPLVGRVFDQIAQKLEAITNA